MEKEPLAKLIWHGHETIESIAPLLDTADQIEITLPSNYNHSLFSMLHPGEPPAQLEKIQASGGPELLGDIASIKGLEELKTLIDPLTAAKAKVEVVSPPRIVITLPVGRGRKGND